MKKVMLFATVLITSCTQVLKTVHNKYPVRENVAKFETTEQPQPDQLIG